MNAQPHATVDLAGLNGPMINAPLWHEKYALTLVAVDTMCVTVAISLAEWVLPHGAVWFSPNKKSFVPTTIQDIWAAIFLGICWMTGLAISHSRSVRVIGSGVEEYRRVLKATLLVFGLLGIASIFVDVRLSRSHLVIVLPVGILMLMLCRWTMRIAVTKIRRSRGQCITRLVVVGTNRAVREFSRSLSRAPWSEYRIVGVCSPRRAGASDLAVPGQSPVPRFGTESDVIDAVLATGAQAVAVTASKRLVGSELARLSWELERLNVELLVAPGLVDVAGQRLHMRPIAGLPLIHVEKPQYDGAKKFKKSLFDVAFSSLVLIGALPVMLLIALLIYLTSPGRIFYLSERIGLDGKPFKMIKFRTMVVGADAMLADLQSLQLVASPRDPLKFQDDPRVTRVGRVLRKYSLDELPQFINVIKRDMSVVGPRPQVLSEVSAYDSHTKRRLLVRPGITGLWQVNGRSDLSWEDSIRLDLFYVENWSMTADFLIAAKTLRAILRHTGAY